METECYLGLRSPTVKWVFKTHQEMPKKLVTSVFVFRERVKAKTVEGKPRTGLKAHDVVQLPEPETKADNHLFRREGGHLGPAGWLCPWERGCQGAVSRGARQHATMPSFYFHICSPHPGLETTQSAFKRCTFSGGPLAKTPAPNAGGWGSIPGQGTRSHIPQLKISNTTTKGWWCQINK